MLATQTGEAGVAEVFRTLRFRLRDSTWTIVFKALIVIHLMIREGVLDAALLYISENPDVMAISGYSEGERLGERMEERKIKADFFRVAVQMQGQNIRKYCDYLVSRAAAFADTKTDYVRSGPGRMRRLTVEKGLLRETEIVQRQIKALLRCNVRRMAKFIHHSYRIIANEWAL